jgi:hypothetical protein
MSSKIDGVPRELLEQLRNVCGDPDLAQDVNSLLAAPECEFHGADSGSCSTYSGQVPCAAPVVERQPVPDYFVQACDKFDWTPEEALKFYAEGKHFDTEGGRTRILCTGAIASYALKNAGGDYADMKGVERKSAQVSAWMLDGSVGGSSLDFQITDLLDTQNRHGGCLVPLYTAPPELAELQATIAQQAALLREVTESVTGRNGTFARIPADWFDRRDASQPAPVSVVELLRETSDYLDGSTRNAVWCDSILHKKMKACLDKVKELNEVKS